MVGKPDYLHNKLKRRCILIILSRFENLMQFYWRAILYLTDIEIAHSPSLFLAYGKSYRMTYGKSNPYIVSERN